MMIDIVVYAARSADSGTCEVGRDESGVMRRSSRVSCNDDITPKLNFSKIREVLDPRTYSSADLKK